MSDIKTKILVFDPGESTGWVARMSDGTLEGGTAPRDHLAIATLISEWLPELVIIETFAMFPGKANSLYWNTFYPCEVIGVLKYLCASWGIEYVMQQPSVKQFAGSLQDDFFSLQKTSKERITEHTKDAYQHLRYYERKHK